MGTDAIEAAAQPFEELVPAAMAVVHHYVSELHRLSADVACALAAGAGGLHGRRTVHVGAGFGADARTACLYGVREAIGVEAGADEVRLDRLVREASDDELRDAIAGDEVCRTLYGSAVVQRAAAELLAERAHLRRLPWPARAIVHRGDALTDALPAALEGRPADAMIGNFMLHWLLLGGRPLAEALERLAVGVRPGGLAVFSVPYHLVAPADGAEAGRLVPLTVYGTELYRRLAQELAGTLGAGAATAATRPIAVADAEVAAGSPSFEHVVTLTRYFAAPASTLVDTMGGAALYEASARTGRPARELASLVAGAVDAAARRVAAADLARPTGTFIRFHVLRRRPS